MNNELLKIGKRMSYLLRHNPEDLKMDENGWVDIDDLLKKLDTTFDVIKEIVDTNDKKRFAYNSNMTKIRASQGHTIDVDLKLKEVEPPLFLYHGTSPTFINAILCSGGLNKMERNHVHLSSNEITAHQVGKRHSKYLEPTILKIESGKMYKDGYKFYLSENNVWLTDHVPNKYIRT